MSIAFASRVLYTLTIKAIALASFFYDDPDPGTFAPIMDKISALARDLWGVAVGLIIIAATLAMILSVLKGTGGMLIGGSIALVEPAINTVAYHFHERIWNRLSKVERHSIHHLAQQM